MPSYKTLTQRIALIGSKEIRKEFEELGKDGAAAFKKIEKAADAAKTGDALSEQLGQLRSEFKLLGTASADFAIQLTKVVAKAAGLATLVAGAVTAVTKFSLAQARAVNDTNNLAQALGLTAEELTSLQFAAQRTNATAEQFRFGMQRLASEIIKTNESAERSDTTLGKLGIRVKNADGSARSTAQVFGDLAARFASMSDGAQKTALAMQLFGSRAGPQLIPLLNEGKEGIAALEAEARRLGITLTTAQAKQASALTNAVDTMNSAVSAVRRDLGLLFAPALIEAAQNFTQLIADNRDTIIAFGESVRDRVVPIIQDLFAVLSGRDADVQNTALITIRDTVLGVANAFILLGKVVATIWRAIEAALQPILDAFNALFGTNLQVRQIVILGILMQFLGVFRALGAAIRVVVAAWNILVRLVGPAAATILAAILAVNAALNLIANVINTVFSNLAKWVIAGATALVNAFSPAIESVIGFFVELGRRAMAIIKSIIEAARRIPVLGDIIPGGSGGAQANAGGGRIRGRGTGTSDSILSWLSNGEWVIRAAAVRKYGDGLLSAINSMRLPRNAFAGFSMGGMVGAAPAFASIPAFADGGRAIAPNRPFNLTIGGETFRDLLAPEDVADRLVKFATSRTVRRAGRRPSWFQ